MKLCKPPLTTFTASLSLGWDYQRNFMETVWSAATGPFLVPWINLAHGKETFPAQVEGP